MTAPRVLATFRLWSLVLLVAGLTVTAIVVPQVVMVKEFDRHLALVLLSERIQRDVSRMHLWFEEALAADQSINLDRDVRLPLEDTIQGVARQRQSYAEPSSRSARERLLLLGELLHQLQEFRHAVDDRWLKRQQAGRTGGSLDQKFDRVYEEILRLSDQLSTGASKVAGEDRRWLLFLNSVAVTVVFLLFLALGLITARGRRALEHKNLELEDRVSERTEDLSRANAQLARARDEAESASAARGRFLASMSHEIRTPINAMLGLGSLLHAREDRADVKRSLQLLLDSGSDLVRMLDDALQLARGDEIVESVAERFDVGELVTSVVGLLEESAIDKGIELRAETPDFLPVVVGDRARVRQILINLIANGIKFTDQGSVVVRATMTQDAADEPAQWAHFEVVDSGPGIPESRRAEVFAPYAQLNSHTTPRDGGIGLGLSICDQLVKTLGGKIGVEGNSGNGSTFWFRIPLTLGHQAEEAVTKGRGSRRVLVVDDNEINRYLAAALLQELDYVATPVSSGSEAIEQMLASEDNFIGILLDCQMPEMDGFETARRLRSEGVTVPILALTASADPEDRRRCRAAGIDDVLFKPLTLEKLGKFLHCWLEGATVSAADSSDVSLDVLESYKPALRQQLVELFLRDVPPQLHAIEQAWATARPEMLQAKAHKLCSSAAHVGATRMETICRELESGAGNGDALLPKLRSLREAFEQTRASLLRWQQSHPLTEAGEIDEDPGRRG